MENHSGKIKVKFVYYLSMLTLILLIAAIFFTINNAMEKQKLRSKAHTLHPTVTQAPLP